MNDRINKKPDRLKQKRAGFYFEGHHIIPKSKGGSGNSHRPKNNSNIVLLTAREHFLAHWLLWRIYRDRSSSLAFHKMMSANKNQKRKLSSRGYEEARLSFAETNKGNQFGRGIKKVVSEEQKKKQSQIMKGRYCGENNPFYGKKHNEITRKKISESRQGISKESIWSYKGKKVVLKNGKIIAVFETSKEVSDFIGCSHSNVRHVLGGKQKTAKGFEIKHFKEYYNSLK